MIRRFGVPYLLCDLFLADASLRRDRITNLVCDPHAGRPRAKNDQAKIAQLLLRDVQPSEDRRESHAACSLDVVVEAGDLWPPLVEESSRCN